MISKEDGIRFARIKPDRRREARPPTSVGAIKVHIANRIGPFANWWLYLWGFVAITLLVVVWFIPFWIWCIAAIGSFGPMEAIGLYSGSPYPPLTWVVRGYLPFWMGIPTIWMFTAAAGATWLHFHHVLSIAAIAALMGWFNVHFLKAYRNINKF